MRNQNSLCFFQKLLALFSLFCFTCKKSGPRVTMKQRGTMVIVNQHCLSCGDESFEWKSPASGPWWQISCRQCSAKLCHIDGRGIHQQSLAGLQAHGVISLFCKGLFFHQRNFLFPVVISYWERYQADLVSKLKAMKDVVWSGDGRFDSMGHSAKFGAYTMFCNTLLKVVHFEILQVKTNFFFGSLLIH